MPLLHTAYDYDENNKLLRTFKYCLTNSIEMLEQLFEIIWIRLTFLLYKCTNSCGSRCTTEYKCY